MITRVPMERSIAAEARRQKRLSKGAERLRSIVGGNALSESFGDKSIIATCDIGPIQSQRPDESLRKSPQKASPDSLPNEPAQRPSEVLQVTAQFRPAVMAKEDAGNMPATANNGSRGTESGDFAQDAIQENRMRKWQQYSSTGSSAKPARQKVRVASLTTTQAIALASWETMDLKLAVTIIYAICCHTAHGMSPPRKSLAFSCWWVFNSRFLLLGLSMAILTLFGTQMFLLLQGEELTEEQQDYFDKVFEKPSWISTLPKLFGMGGYERLIEQIKALQLFVQEAVSFYPVFLVSMVLLEASF